MSVSRLINSRIITVSLLGFSSGLPLALVGSTLQAWLTQSAVNIFTIGLFTLVGLPYLWKFLWAPFLDAIAPPLGRRKGWVIIFQMTIGLGLLGMASINPSSQLGLLTIVAVLIAFASASQDVVVDAYRTELLSSSERGVGAAAYIAAYRIAYILTGGGCLILAEYLGWKATYQCMAALAGVLSLLTLILPQPHEPIRTVASTFGSNLIASYKDLFSHTNIIWILTFVVLYKLGDALTLSLMSTFLLKHLHFTLSQVGFAFKTVGMLATIIGAFLGGSLLKKISLAKALFYFGGLQALSNFAFIGLSIAEPNYYLMLSAITIESLCSGLSTAVFLVYLMGLCNQHYTATQFAIFSALSSIGRVIAGPIAGMLVLNLGWVNFYLICFLTCLPSLILLAVMERRNFAHVASMA